MKFKFDITKILFFLGTFLIEFALYTQNVVFFADSTGNMMLAGMAILFIDIIVTFLKLKMSLKNWIIAFIFLILSLISYIITKESILLQLCLVVIPAINIDFSEIIKKNLIFKILLGLMIYACFLTGNTVSDSFVRYGVIRYAFGFKHPNTYAFFLLMLFLQSSYLIYQNRTKKTYLTCILLSLLTFGLMSPAASRTSEVVLILFDIFLTFDFIFKKRNIKGTLKYSFIFVALTLLSLLICYLYKNGNTIAFSINKLLSNRVYLSNLFISENGFSFFGREIYYFDTLDNVFIRILLNFGFMGWFMYLYLFNANFKSAINNKDNIFVIITLVLLIYGLSEWYTIRPVLNVFLPYFFTFFLKGGVKNER